MVDKKELTEEEVIGEKLSGEYHTKVSFKDSAELRMVMYVVPAAVILIIIAVVISKLQ